MTLFQLVASEIIQNLPGYSNKLILKKIPRVLKEKDTRSMGLRIAKGVTERNMVRVIKLAAGNKQ